MTAPKSFSIALPAAAIALPLGSATATLFDSTVAFGPKQLRHLPIKRLSFASEHDQAGTLVLSRSIDGGTNWDVYYSNAFSIPAANNITGPVDFLIDTFEDVKLEWTNGGTNQTVWRPELHGHEDRVPGS